MSQRAAVPLLQLLQCRTILVNVEKMNCLFTVSQRSDTADLFRVKNSVPYKLGRSVGIFRGHIISAKNVVQKMLDTKKPLTAALSCYVNELLALRTPFIEYSVISGRSQPSIKGNHVIPNPLISTLYGEDSTLVKLFVHA